MPTLVRDVLLQGKRNKGCLNMEHEIDYQGFEKKIVGTIKTIVVLFH